MRPIAFVLAVLTLSCAASQARAQQHPFARAGPPLSILNGSWNGVNLERRSACANAQNNGSRGTYAQFEVQTAPTGEFVIVQAGVTGLNCEYRGRVETSAEGLVLQGTYGCTDGKQGSFRSAAVQATANLLHIRFATQLAGTESCAVDAILSMARHPP